MPNDYIKKEPSKTEKMLYELAMNQHQMEKGLWSTSTLVMALCILTKQDPQQIAQLLVSGDAEIKEFSTKVNEIAKGLDEAKHKDHDHSKDKEEAK